MLTLVCLLTAKVFVAASSAACSSAQPLDTSPNQAPPALTVFERTRVAVLMAATDLTPASLAALDASAQDLQGVFSKFAPQEQSADLVLARMLAASEAAGRHASAMALARNDPTPQNVRAYRTARTELHAKHEQLATARKALLISALSPLSPGQRTQLRRLRAAERAGLPVEFGAALTTPAEQSQISEDLSTERNAISANEPVPGDVQARLAALRASTAVSAARTRLDLRRAAISAAALDAQHTTTDSPADRP